MLVLFCSVLSLPLSVVLSLSKDRVTDCDWIKTSMEPAKLKLDRAITRDGIDLSREQLVALAIIVSRFGECTRTSTYRYVL